MPISKIASTGKLSLRGVTPNGVTVPFGVRIWMESPMVTPRVAASREPITTPPPAP